jgi:hypothetical protein
MGDLEHHRRLAKEKRDAAIEEYDKGRWTVVGARATCYGELMERLAMKGSMARGPKKP